MIANINHEDREHAVLSASGAHRWLECPGSVRLEEQVPEQTSEYALQGTLAHEMAEIVLRYKVKMIDIFGDPELTPAMQAKEDDATKEYAEAFEQLKQNDQYYDGMLEDVMPYVNAVMRRWNEVHSNPFASIEIESRSSWEHVYKGGFGTNDARIFADGVLDVYDLKFGMGVAVSAEDNPQGKLYAEGARYELAFVEDIEKINIHIIQPRIGNYSTWTTTPEELTEWLDSKVKPIAEAIYNGETKTVAGEHCKFCKVKARCRALADDNLELAKKEFADPELLSDEELEEVADKAERLNDWVKSVMDHLLKEALNGKEFSRYKVVAGAARRKISDEEAAIRELMKKKYRKGDITETKLVGLGKLDKIVGGKDRLADVLGDLLTTPEGKPTLVPMSDKRPDLIKNSAIQDFSNLEE